MITVRQMNEDERGRVGIFVQNIMREQYGCDAYALPRVVFSAWRDDELVGAMGLSMSDGAPFSLEKSYALDYRTFPEVFDRTKIVELGRWSVTVPHVSEALMCVAICYALQNRREWGIGEIKPQVARRFARMGIAVTALHGEPILDAIPEGVRPYYLLPPRPSPHVIMLADARAVLCKRVKEGTSGDVSVICP